MLLVVPVVIVAALFFSKELFNLLHENRNVKPIPTIALEADRFDVSNRTAAAFSTAALIDFGVVSAKNRTHIIDSNKVWRARQKLRKNVRKTIANIELSITIY